MIGSLRGRILEVHPSYALVEVQGIGYACRASMPTLSSLQAGEERFLYVYDHVREDVHDLFAFTSHEEKEFFERLLSISGVGPKVALTILSAGSIAVVRQAVMTGNVTLLTSVPGVGKKTAQKIILELKGQLVEDDDVGSEDREVLEALISLGYSASQAREGLKYVSSAIVGTSERVREALRNLSR